MPDPLVLVFGERTLARMLDSLVVSGGGTVDELSRFARPVTGAYYFVPSAESVAAFGEDRRA